jgi:CheY-like chemotaxis protein/HPt (histidine-containing phosphotransfer) domain-containing protein
MSAQAHVGDVGGQVGRHVPLILVAEDNQTNRLVILKQLALLGFAADVAGDGQEALSLWRAGSYSLVLTDLHMPLMDGYGLARAIRAEEAAGSRVPIIAVTANAMRDEELRCIAGGMDGYLSKPVLLTRLRAVIQQNIGAAPPALETGADKRPAMELATLTALVGDDPDDVAEVLQSFTRSARESATALDAAMNAGNAVQLGSLAHQIKGAAVSIGAVRLGEICRDLEEAAGLGAVGGLKSLHASLQAELVRVVDFISRTPQDSR